jgi:uncharacterized protein
VPYHAGELAVQEKAGVAEMARRVGKVIRPEIPPAAWGFLSEQPMAVAASVDDGGAVWASLLTGEPGFMRVEDERTLRVDAEPAPADPLAGNLRDGAPVGLLVLDPRARRRAKLKGAVRTLPGSGFRLRTERVYALCPKYIQARAWSFEESTGRPSGGPSGGVERGGELTEGQRARISTADTFFVSSFHPETGTDASHRGGMPGFVEVADEKTLAWPDYAGNKMFNTLGNITANPKAGLLFVDFDTGDTLQLTGEAEVDWDEGHAARFAGAERVVRFRVGEVLETRGASPLRWRFLGYSPFNPA